MLCPSAARRGPRSAVNSSGRIRLHQHRPTTGLPKRAPRCSCRPRTRVACHPVTLRFSSPGRSDRWAALALSISSSKPSPATSIPGSDYSEAKSDILATTLAAIDVTLAGLFWSWGADEDILARLVKKTLFVGVFAFLIGNWNSLARIIFESFAGLGLKASGTGLSSADFLRPGKDRPGRTRCWTAHPRFDLRPDGLCQLLREFHPDCRFCCSPGSSCCSRSLFWPSSSSSP